MRLAHVTCDAIFMELLRSFLLIYNIKAHKPLLSKFHKPPIGLLFQFQSRKHLYYISNSIYPSRCFCVYALRSPKLHFNTILTYFQTPFSCKIVIAKRPCVGTNFVYVLFCRLEDIESSKMGFGRASTSRSGDYLEGMLNDYVGGRNKQKAQKSASTKFVAALTCLQFFFAVYATFLLYYMGPSIDLRTKPEFTWATKIAQQWKQLMITPHVIGHYQQASSSLVMEDVLPTTPSQVCENEKIDFLQKKSNDVQMIKLKRELYDEVLNFQSKTFGTETLQELMAMKSKWDLKGPNTPKITVLLNHFKRKTLCAQLDSLLQQTLPFHHAWVLSFGSPNEASLRRIVDTYNDSRISFISSSYDFKYYGRFQMALQTEADLVYVIDDDMIPGRKMLQILAHVAGTEKYKNSVLGSIGRILPFRQKDFTFPSYRKFRSKEAGLYLPDPAYDITVDKIVQVDFLSSSWFLSADLVKTLFTETPFTFSTGEDLHLRFVNFYTFTPCC